MKNLLRDTLTFEQLDKLTLTDAELNDLLPEQLKAYKYLEQAVVDRNIHKMFVEKQALCKFKPTIEECMNNGIQDYMYDQVKKYNDYIAASKSNLVSVVD